MNFGGLGGLHMAYYRYGDEDYKALLSRSKYSVEISKVLFDKDTLSHSELCDAIKIKKNNLSNIVKKLEPFGILFVRRIGKNVYYSLSPKGFEFYRYFTETEKPFARIENGKTVKQKTEVLADSQFIYNK